MGILLAIAKVSETYFFDPEVKRKMNWFKKKGAQKIGINLLTFAELEKAARELYKHSQLESFPTKNRHLINNKEVKKT